MRTKFLGRSSNPLPLFPMDALYDKWRTQNKKIINEYKMDLKKNSQKKKKKERVLQRLQGQLKFQVIWILPSLTLSKL